jgi:hypothetical protein
MKTVLIVLTILSLTSCNMQKYCAERFPSPERVRDSISYIEKVIYRDTTIYLTVAGESKVDTLYVESIFDSAVSQLETSLAYSKAFFFNGKLIHNLRQKDSVLSFLLEKAIKEHSTIEYKEREIIKVELKNVLTGWQYTQMYAAWILAVVILVGSLWRKLPTAILNKAVGVFKKPKPP